MADAVITLTHMQVTLGWQDHNVLKVTVSKVAANPAGPGPVWLPVDESYLVTGATLDPLLTVLCGSRPPVQ